MNKIRAYFDEVYQEMVHKVSWPTWSELQESAIIVMVAAVIFSIVVAFMDLAFREGMSFLYKFI
ncbi:MAG: preprotein translocase subunit SecE [Bacteroidia bacterium]|jgi:preprotein translocase subunit SecE